MSPFGSLANGTFCSTHRLTQASREVRSGEQLDKGNVTVANEVRRPGAAPRAPTIPPRYAPSPSSVNFLFLDWIPQKAISDAPRSVTHLQ